MSNETSPREDRLSPNVYVLSAVSFFQDAASELLYPILPLNAPSLAGHKT